MVIALQFLQSFSLDCKHRSKSCKIKVIISITCKLFSFMSCILTYFNLISSFCFSSSHNPCQKVWSQRHSRYWEICFVGLWCRWLPRSYCYLGTVRQKSWTKVNFWLLSHFFRTSLLCSCVFLGQGNSNFMQIYYTTSVFQVFLFVNSNNHVFRTIQTPKLSTFTKLDFCIKQIKKTEVLWYTQLWWIKMSLAAHPLSRVRHEMAWPNKMRCIQN